MIFQIFSFVTPLPVARQNNTVMPAGVARRGFPRRKRCLTWQVLSRQCMWRTMLVGRASGTGASKRVISAKKNLGAIIIEILNKKD